MTGIALDGAWPPAASRGDPPEFGRLAPMPFPVNAPFRVRADLARLLGEGDAPPRLLQSDAAYPACARIKRAHLDDPERPLTRVLPGSDPRRLIGALGAALAAIARSQPEVAGAVQPPASPRSGSAGSDAGEGEAAGGRFVLRRAALQLVLEPEVRVTALTPASEPVAERLEPRIGALLAAWAKFAPKTVAIAQKREAGRIRYVLLDDLGRWPPPAKAGEIHPTAFTRVQPIPARYRRTGAGA